MYVLSLWIEIHNSIVLMKITCPRGVCQITYYPDSPFSSTCYSKQTNGWPPETACLHSFPWWAFLVYHEILISQPKHTLQCIILKWENMIYGGSQEESHHRRFVWYALRVLSKSAAWLLQISLFHKFKSKYPTSIHSSGIDSDPLRSLPHVIEGVLRFLSLPLLYLATTSTQQQVKSLFARLNLGSIPIFCFNVIIYTRVWYKYTI